MLELDAYYADQLGPGGGRVATQLVKQFADPAPYDLDGVDLRHYRRLDPVWRDWDTVVASCRRLAASTLSEVARRGDRL